MALVHDFHSCGDRSCCRFSKVSFTQPTSFALPLSDYLLLLLHVRDIAEKNHLGENWRLDCALKLTIIAGIIAACGLPMLIGILTVTKTHLMSLAAFLILIISFLQVATMVMFEIAMHKSNAISICEATLSLLPYKCWQVSCLTCA